jgi:hypothetical protein
MGDFNYRINLKYENCIKEIEKKNFEELLKNDQLLIEKQNFNIFNGFKEGVIKFLPSYKFDIGTNFYDTSEKKRIPAYTDRIFYKDNDDIEILTYDSYLEIKNSDHKPVIATFEVIVSFFIK